MLLVTLNKTNIDPVDWNGSYLMDTIHRLPHKMVQILLEWACHLDYYGKSLLSQSQYSFEYPDKDVEVIQKPTTASPEFHSTKL